MKLFLILILFPCIAYCQTEYVTQVTYSELNEVDLRMQNFMQNKMGMVITTAPTFGKEDGMQTLTIRYSKQAIMGTSYDPHVYFKYTLFDMSPGKAIIKSCQIYGDYGLVIDFYVRFWPTTINIDAVKKQRIAYSYFWQDKITLGLNPENNTGRLSIINTTIKSIAEYKSKAKDQQKYKDSVNIVGTKIKQAKIDSAEKINAAATIYRDSLIKVAQTYGIPFHVTNSISPSTEWLEYVISNKKKDLNSGNSRNNSDIKSLVDSIQKIMKIEKGDYFFVYVLFHVDKDGVIASLDQRNGDQKFITKYLPQINNVCVGKKLEPFTSKDGLTYPSQISCIFQCFQNGLSISRE